MKIGWVTYFAAVACALPLAGSETVAPKVSADELLYGADEMSFATTGSTGSSGPPLPTCGNFLREERFGPITISHYWNNWCNQNRPGKPYLEQSMTKIKKIHQNGSIWECPITAKEGALCTDYFTSDCPDNTCVK